MRKLRPVPKPPPEARWSCGGCTPPSPNCRDAFLLNRIEDLSHAEIAARLGVSVRTIDRHMARAVGHLREHFGRGYEV
jgi:Sigma-70, region 4